MQWKVKMEVGRTYNEGSKRIREKKEKRERCDEREKDKRVLNGGK